MPAACALGVLLALSACDEESTCKIGCDESRGDCLDDPTSYDSESLCVSPEEGLSQCEENLCDDVYQACADDCSQRP